ncbi:p21-activated protein kinase-interacting protein 1-like [Stylonychia lemnae]|uniref:p21-activated protein kinase-interacting protein 1-like n=1 Tax=Stylonychia lemnae TaxID=5949 RepID=A0A078B6P0_STYLE|nr:p21-activated protein kinase-interacting protein 1-like [Stylonychia lemnae]|eukprot:CDW90039.1 p21-activated protein kinase-interacting protein 1-like [Stylonychia lemnae]
MVRENLKRRGKYKGMQISTNDKTKRELDNRMVSYFSDLYKCFIYIGNYWVDRPQTAHKDIQEAKNITLKVKELISQVVVGAEDSIQLKFRERAKGEHSDALINGQADMSKGSRRTKERKIGEVILAVKKWRELYTVGERQPDQSFKQQSLEDAALKVGISKKSLDDYFLQLKNGQRNGFNFNEHKNDKIGILRAYNKKNRKADISGGQLSGGQQDKYIISIGNYEGGLLGLSFTDFDQIQEGVETEYAFNSIQVSNISLTILQGSINAMDGNKKLLALGGYQEIIKLYDVSTKKEKGELMEHQGSITCLQFFKNTYLISGSDDGVIILWRCKDWVPLHKLRVKNVSRVINFSLHPSGRMLLVLYENNMFRLWNMLDGRCTFKKKLGLNEETEKVQYKVQQVKWGGDNGEAYAILYDKKVEILGVDSDVPKSSVTSEAIFVCMEFINQNELLLADVNGRFTYLKGIQSEATTTISIIQTKVARFRQIRHIQGSDIVISISTEGSISFWSLEKLQSFNNEMGNIKAVKTIKSKHRLLCMSVNYLGEPEDEIVVKKNKDKKKLKRKGKLSKDEKVILKRQKTH